MLDDFIFPSRVNYMGHLSTRQYARLVDEWVGAVGLKVAEYGTHSMRRTKASLIYKATGNLRAVQILLGHQHREHRALSRRGRCEMRQPDFLCDPDPTQSRAILGLWHGCATSTGG
jgi:integrase